MSNAAKIELMDADATEKEREQNGSNPALLAYGALLANPTLWANLSSYIDGLAARETKDPWSYNGIHNKTPFWLVSNLTARLRGAALFAASSLEPNVRCSGAETVHPVGQWG